jgi:hypothetical protein
MEWRLDSCWPSYHLFVGTPHMRDGAHWSLRLSEAWNLQIAGV